MTFHDDKLWQDAFAALLDLLEITEDEDGDLVHKVRKQGMIVLTDVAPAVASRDRKFRVINLRTVGTGNIVSIRSLLSVMWAREMLSDDQFGKLDGAYEALEAKLPR